MLSVISPAQWWEERISGAFTSAVEADHTPATHLFPCTALPSEHNSSDRGWLNRWRLSARYICHVPGHITMDILYISCYPSWFQEARSHLNLGAMLHLNGKFMEAAISYREALRLQPDDVTTLTNLHKLYNLLGKGGTTWHHTGNDTAPPD